MQKISVTVTVKLLIKANRDVDIDEVLNEMDYNFTSCTKGAKIQDTFIDDYEVIGNK